MGTTVPGEKKTSAPPGSDLADAYMKLQKYLIHKPNSFFGARADKSQKSTWSLAGKEILGNNGAFYTSDMFALQLDKKLEIGQDDLTIYWSDLRTDEVKDRPFQSTGLKRFIDYKGANSNEREAYEKKIKEYDAVISSSSTAPSSSNPSLEVYVLRFIISASGQEAELDNNTGTFNVKPVNKDGKEVDPGLQFNFRRQRAVPDIKDLEKQFSAAESVAKRSSFKDASANTNFVVALKGYKEKLLAIAREIPEDKAIGIAGSNQFNMGNQTPSELYPQVALYEYKGNTISLETSTTDYCDAFFNLIDNVNLSLAVPFIRINIIDRLSKAKNKEPRLSLVSFLRSTGNKDIDDSIFSGSRPVLKSAKDPTSRKILSGKYVGVDVFQAPSTLLPDPTDLITNPRRLDPSVPLMTLQSLNISIESQGTAMLSRKRGELSIIIHDRSRLGDVRSLLSLGDFSSLYFDIEWGYIHPHGDVTFDNPVGQYLNSMRLREIYAPNTYTMSMGEGGALTVNINMLAGGYLDSTNAPVTTGDFVPRSLAMRMFSSYVNNLIFLTTRPDESDQYQAEVRPITEILVSKDTEGKFVKRDFIEKIIFENEFNNASSVILPDEQADAVAELKQLLAESNKSQSYKTTDFIADLTNNLRSSNVTGFGSNTFSLINTKYGGANQNSFASVGSILTQCAGIPLAMSGLYSEVQIHVFRFNDDAGWMSGKPISQSCLSIEDYIGKTDDNNSLYSADSVTTALSRICKQLSNPDALTYGIGTPPSKDEKGTQDKKDSAPSASAGKPAASTKTAAASSGQTPPNKTPSFTVPNVKYDMRTVPAKVFSEKNTLPIEGVANPEKPILQVIIYDDNRFVDSTDISKAYSYLSSVRKKPITGQTSAKNDNTLSIDDAKTLSKIAYPNITYGAVNSVIKNIAVSTNSRSAIGTYATIQAGKEMLNDQLKSVSASEIRQMQLIPGSVTLTILGLPIIERGQCIYLDLGTGTSLDQLYKVTAVRHNLSSDFTTDLTLQFAGQGTLVNMENVIDDYLKGLEQSATRPTSASQDSLQARREAAAEDEILSKN